MHQLKFGMACCQATKKIGDKLIGNPHDIKIFEYIGWDQTDKLNDRNGYAYTIVRPSDKNYPVDKETDKRFVEHDVEMKILKQFEFQSKLQRMSVICLEKTHPNFLVFMKGSPEIVHMFCDPSTIPVNYF